MAARVWYGGEGESSSAARFDYEGDASHTPPMQNGVL